MNNVENMLVKAAKWWEGLTQKERDRLYKYYGADSNTLNVYEAEMLLKSRPQGWWENLPQEERDRLVIKYNYQYADTIPVQWIYDRELYEWSKYLKAASTWWNSLTSFTKDMYVARFGVDCTIVNMYEQSILQDLKMVSYNEMEKALKANPKLIARRTCWARSTHLYNVDGEIHVIGLAVSNGRLNSGKYVPDQPNKEATDWKLIEWE